MLEVSLLHTDSWYKPDLVQCSNDALKGRLVVKSAQVKCVNHLPLLIELTASLPPTPFQIRECSKSMKLLNMYVCTKKLANEICIKTL